MRVRIAYFAILRDQRGQSDEVYSTEMTTAAGLYGELAQRYGLSLDPGIVRFAINGEFVSPETPLTDGCEVALVPPVSGG